MDPRSSRWWIESSSRDISELSVLLGKTLVSAKFHRALPTYDDEVDAIEFACGDGEKFVVRREIASYDFLFVERIVGDLSALIGLPIVRAEWRQGDDLGVEDASRMHLDIATEQASVTIDWYCEAAYDIPRFEVFRYVSDEEYRAKSDAEYAVWEAERAQKAAEARAEEERIQRIRLGDARFSAMTDDERIAERADYEARRFKRPFLLYSEGYRGGTRYSAGLVDWSGIFGGTK